MVSTTFLYQVAEQKNIPIIRTMLPENGSLCIQSDDGACYIGMDGEILAVSVEERVHLAHELGHCVTGSFYNRWAKCDVRRRHEGRADKWAIQQFLSENNLDDAVADGYTEMYELAEHFGVTEDFMRKAVCWYTYGNLDVEHNMAF